MRYARHIRAGLAGGLLALVASVLWLVVPGLVAITRFKREGGGSGSYSVLIDTNRLLLAAAIGFAAGWYWQVRRLRR
jgi:hypothetical protein